VSSHSLSAIPGIPERDAIRSGIVAVIRGAAGVPGVPPKVPCSSRPGTSVVYAALQRIIARADGLLVASRAHDMDDAVSSLVLGTVIRLRDYCPYRMGIGLSGGVLGRTTIAEPTSTAVHNAIEIIAGNGSKYRSISEKTLVPSESEQL
jgi:hypothetical protein